MSTPDNPSTDFDMLMQRLAEKNLSGDKIAEIVASAENTLSPDQAKKVAEKAKEKMGNKEFSESGEKPSRDVPEADLVAPDGYAGDRRKEKEDKTESQKSGDKSKGKDDKLENKRGKAEKGRSSKDEMKNEGGSPRDGSSEDRADPKGKKTSREIKSDNIKRTLEYLKKRRELKDISDKDPLEAYRKLAEEKPSGLAPAYIQQKYDSDRAELLRSVDERIRTSPEGTKYSPEKLGEELYKYQTNADTKAFAEEVLKNNKNNEELQESYDEAAHKTPQQDEQKKQEEEKQKEQDNEPKKSSFLRRLFRRDR